MNAQRGCVGDAGAARCSGSVHPPSRWLEWTAAMFCAICMTAGAAAAEVSDALSLPRLIERAERDNKDLQAARFAVDIARARLLQAGLRDNPRLDLSVRSDFAFKNEGEYGSAVAISQSFPVAGRLLREKDVARVDIALAETEVANAERLLAGEVAADVYRLLVVDRQIESRSALIEQQSRLTRTTKERFKAAEVSELDVNTAQLDLQRLIQERSLLLGQRESLLQSLNSRIGRSATAPLAIDESIPSFEKLPALAQALGSAFDRRADLRGALLSADRADAEKALAKSKRWEDWSLGLELSQDKQVIEGLPPQGNDRAIGVSVSIPLPLRNRNRGLLAEADAAHDQALARIDALRQQIAGEVSAAHAEAARLQAALAQYDQKMLPVSASNVRLAQQGYRQGLVPIFDVVQAQRQQADLSAAYLATLDQWLQALVRLHTATGDYVLTASVDAGN